MLPQNAVDLSGEARFEPSTGSSWGTENSTCRRICAGVALRTGENSCRGLCLLSRSRDSAYRRGGS
jgi:hypothetical protein